MKHLLSILLFLLLSLFSCRRSSHEAMVFIRTDTLMSLSPDSACRVLERLYPLLNDFSERERSLFILHQLNAFYRIDQELAPYEEEVDEVLQYFLKENDDVNAGKAYLLKARMEVERKRPEQAVTFFHHAVAELEKKEKGLFLAMTYSDLGHVYTMQSLFDEAEDCHSESHKVYDEIDDMKGCLGEVSYLAYLYLFKGEPQKATEIYNEALLQVEELKDTLLWAFALNNASVADRQSENYDKALDKIRFSIALSMSCNREPNYRPLAETFYVMGYRDSAYKYLEKSFFSKKIEVRAATYSLLRDMRKEEGDLKGALEYDVLYEACKDSISDNTKTVELLRLNYRQKMSTALARVNGKHRSWQMTTLVSSLVILLAGGFTLLYWNRKKKRAMTLYQEQSVAQKENICILNTKVQHLQNELQALREQPANITTNQMDVTLSIEAKEEQLRAFESEILDLRIKLFKSTPVGQRIAKLDECAKRKDPLNLLKPTERSELFACLNSIFEADINDLAVKLPSLTTDDHHFCCLSFSGFSTQTIAACFGYNDSQVVRQRRYRIKQKMKECDNSSFYYARIFER